MPLHTRRGQSRRLSLLSKNRKLVEQVQASRMEGYTPLATTTASRSNLHCNPSQTMTEDDQRRRGDNPLATRNGALLIPHAAAVIAAWVNRPALRGGSSLIACLDARHERALAFRTSSDHGSTLCAPMHPADRTEDSPELTNGTAAARPRAVLLDVGNGTFVQGELHGDWRAKDIALLETVFAALPNGSPIAPGHRPRFVFSRRIARLPRLALRPLSRPRSRERSARRTIRRLRRTSPSRGKPRLEADPHRLARAA